MATINVIDSSFPIDVTEGGTGASSLTNHGVLIGSGTGEITPLSVGTNGQILVSSTGADPVMATITSASKSVVFSIGAGTLGIEVSGGDILWAEETGTTKTMSNMRGYIANNGAEIDFTLPASAVIGKIIAIAGKGAGKYKISQNAGQTIYNATDATTTGASGELTADEQYACVELVCIIEDTDWVVINSIGTFTAT